MNFIEEIQPETSVEVSTLRTSIEDLDVLINGAYGAISGPAGIGQFQLIEAYSFGLLNGLPTQ